jgi:DNA polymerase III epsilon subunit-like protein
MDDLVLPDTPITDYNTRYSGITAVMMAGVTRTLADAQRSLFSFMGPETLLVLSMLNAVATACIACNVAPHSLYCCPTNTSTASTGRSVQRSVGCPRFLAEDILQQ